MVNASFVVLLVTAVMATDALAAPLPPAPRRRCSDPPSPVTRVWLQTPATASTFDAEAAKTVVDRTWLPAGLTFDWLPPSPQRRADDADVVIIVEQTPLKNAPKGALGVVRFAGGQPQKIVRVSTGTIADWIAARMIERRLWPGNARAFLGSPRASRMVERAMGYVIAHELGHVLLADKNHSGEGVMQASYVDVVGLDESAPLMKIDDGVRERVRLRLAGLAMCN